MAREIFPTPEINLASSSDPADRPGGRFLTWALSWGKKIVILTELVVLLAFLSRFWLDSTVADLAEKIEQKKAVVLASAEFERQFRSLASRTDQAKQIEKMPSPVAVYDEVKARLPAGAAIGQKNFAGQTVSFAGSSNETVLAELVSAFRDQPGFGDVTVEKVAKKGSSLSVDFALRATYLK